MTSNRKKHSDIIKPALLAVLLFAGFGSHSAARGEASVAVVADVYGAVAVAHGASTKPADRWPVQLLQCFPARNVLYLEDGARATLFFPASGNAFELAGPGRFELAADGVRPLSGAPPPNKSVLNAAFRSIKLDRSNLAPAGVRMRDPRLNEAPLLIAPRGVVVSPTSLIFRWDGVGEARSYRFRLARSSRDLIYETLTDQTQLQLPEDVVLAPGDRLLWHVEEASAEHRNTPAWQAFVIATPAVSRLAGEIDRNLSSPKAAELNLREAVLMQQMRQEKPEAQ